MHTAYIYIYLLRIISTIMQVMNIYSRIYTYSNIDIYIYIYIYKHSYIVII